MIRAAARQGTEGGPVEFWSGVAIAYVLIVGLGLALGLALGERFRNDGGSGRGAEAPSPAPSGPRHGKGDDPAGERDALRPLDWSPLTWPPLGSAFDRALLPGAFTDEPTPIRH